MRTQQLGGVFNHEHGSPAAGQVETGACHSQMHVPAAHVEFDRAGRFALVSIWEDDGALVVYDAATFTEVKRLPMSKPSGKYNVWNKINFSDGTSH